MALCIRGVELCVSEMYEKPTDAGFTSCALLFCLADLWVSLWPYRATEEVASEEPGRETCSDKALSYNEGHRATGVGLEGSGRWCLRFAQIRSTSEFFHFWISTQSVHENALARWRKDSTDRL